MDRFQSLLAFARVVEAGSFARAADRLDLSVSAVSRHVSDLESHLGVRLLNRTTRRLSLTETGQTFYERCVQLLADLDEAEEAVTASAVVPRGTLRVLQPVKSDGSPDTLRKTVYQGEAQLMTNMGPLPISFDIDAATLADAIAGYAEATKAGIERAMREIQEMRRQASSSIVLPPAGATLGPGGGLGGGGKIQIP